MTYDGGVKVPRRDSRSFTMAVPQSIVHALASSMWAQGNTNVSHGCLNLSPADASWYFDRAVAGDVVEIRGTGGPDLQVWQNGDWSVPWDAWHTGSPA